DAKPRIIDEQALMAKTNAIDKDNLWHYRLGHPGQNVTKRLGFKVLEEKCKACEMAKSHRQPFDKQMSRAQEALGRIHSDLVGPLSPEASGSYQGAKYVLTFIDDHSRFAFVHFLSKKDEVFMTFKGFKAHLEKKLGRKIKILHTDRGGEYISLEMKEILYGEKPSLEHLRIIWSDAYAHINKAQRRGGKLGPRAHKLKLIGYDDEYA